uniref:Pre-mRNA-splicing factor 38 n=1 Tax=Percolomonas cosmopolitus TaxID=63605 RepID=A0A7S1PFD5_9EUKA
MSQRHHQQNSHLWLLNPTHSIKTLNLTPLIHSKVLSSESFKALKDVKEWKDFVKYLKRALKGEQQQQQQNRGGAAPVSFKFLEMGKNRQHAGAQMTLFEWMMKMHMIWRDDMKKYVGMDGDATGAGSHPKIQSLDDYVRYIRFNHQLASNSSIVWIEIALYCLWIRHMIDPQWQMDMYRSLLDSQPRKLLSIPIFARFDDVGEVEKITMPILVDKLISHQRMFGAVLPRLPRRFQEDMRHQWRAEMHDRGVSLKRKQQDSGSKRKRDDKDDSTDKDKVKVEKVKITSEGLSRFSKKPQQKKDGFLDLSRYVSSQYSEGSLSNGTSSTLNYHKKDTIQIGRPKKKRRIGL